MKSAYIASFYASLSIFESKCLKLSVERSGMEVVLGSPSYRALEKQRGKLSRRERCAEERSGKQSC